MPTLCLNMIVKNESKNITRLLKSVLPVIDTYCICDTGSTDNTQEVIKQFFDKHNITGKIVSEPFKNFAYNRNFALQACLGMSEYILLLDADMILNINNNFNKISFYESKADIFYLIQKSGLLEYKNVRIVKNNGLYKYIGVTHEYLSHPDDATSKLLTELIILDIGDGGCKKNKFERDIQLLTKGIEEDPTNVRYHFYLANSYFDSGVYDLAIKYYKKRITMGGWNEEIWYSYYRIGLCYEKTENMNEAIATWLNAYEIIPERLENIYKIINYYRINGKNKLANIFYTNAKNVLDKKFNLQHHLFLEKEIYTYKIYNEYTIFSYYIGNKNINNEFISVMNNCADNTTINCLLSNMKFYQDILEPIESKNFNTKDIKQFDNENYEMISSTPCIINDYDENNKDGYLLNVQTVNYKILDTGNYGGVDKHIISGQILYKLDNHFNILEKNEIPIDYDKSRYYIGVEDVKMFLHNNEFLFLGTTQNSKKQIGMVRGIYDIDNLSYKEVENMNNCEKNWVYFKDIDDENQLKVVYKWHPLTIGIITDNNKLNITEEKSMPLLFSRVRGSTCGFVYKDEIWFVVHMVSYENPRQYYHLVVVFDKKMNLLQYTSPFKFEGAPIEFCLGLIVKNNQVIMTYSTWDRTSNVSIYDKNYIESKFITNEN